MIKNIIIFGKNGQVANDLLKIFSKKKQFKITNYSSKDIDFSDLTAVKNFLPKLPKTDLRYLKLEILKANGQHAIIAELEVGQSN